MGANLNRLEEYNQFREHLLLIDYQLGYNGQSTETWVFSDEAGTHSGSKYFGIGGLFVRRTSVSGKNLGLDLQNLCQSNKWTDEFKWSDLSRGNIHRYREFTDMFFKRPKTIRFHCIIIDRSLFTKGDSHATDVIFKFYYLLLAYRLNPTATTYSLNRSMFIPDKLSLSDDYWTRLFHSVNVSLKRHYDLDRYPLVKCLPTESKICPEIQMADIILGSIVAWYNSNFKSELKREFAENLVSRIKACEKSKASIWEWQPTN
ncbi:MAG: DUF3800 domain-containing protein [Anaerolineales bacterium]